VALPSYASPLGPAAPAACAQPVGCCAVPLAPAQRPLAMPLLQVVGLAQASLQALQQVPCWRWLALQQVSLSVSALRARQASSQPSQVPGNLTSLFSTPDPPTPHLVCCGGFSKVSGSAPSAPKAAWIKDSLTEVPVPSHVNPLSGTQVWR
jgi:hypothetical protein